VLIQINPDCPDIVEVAAKPKQEQARLKACASAEVIPLSSSAHSSPVPECDPKPRIVTVQLTSIFPERMLSPFFTRVMLLRVSILCSRVQPWGENNAFSRSV